MSKVFLVVGMHRSATSLVAQGLARAGVHMGDRLLGPAPSNPHGHWEDVDALHLNVALLAANGGDWRRPPDRIHTPPDLERRIGDLVRSRNAAHGLWGMKDPRLCLTWPAWLPHLKDDDLHVVNVWRHPDRIAESLTVRNGMPHGEGVALARLYQRSARRLQDHLTPQAQEVMS